MAHGVGFDTLSDGPAPGAPGLPEILARLERRLAWYGLPHFSVEKVEVADGESIVATIAERGHGAWREGFDRRTGALKWRVRDRDAA